MGHYANPVTDVTTKCRQIEGNTFEELQAQLRDGEGLVGLYDRFLFKQAPLLYNEHEFEGFEDQYQHGIVNRIGFYAAPLEMFPRYMEEMNS